MKQKLFLLGFFLIVTFLTVKSQSIDATLVEINYFDSSDPLEFIDDGAGGFYFSAVDDDYGRELWHSDGTSSGAYMVKEIRPGSNTSDIILLSMVGDDIYFTADDNVHGSELWKSDGTEAGTFMVKDINSSSTNTYNEPAYLIEFNGKAYFAAFDGVNGFELWTSDGTEAGTYMVKDINPNGSGSSYPTDLFVFNEAIYFVANDGTNGKELWKSDGTEVGTTLFKSLFANYSSGINTDNDFLILNNEFYFFGNDGVNGFELWKSDGTESGTTMLKNINPNSGSSGSYLRGAVIDNLIIFEAYDVISGNEIWKTDGTEAGTTMIKNIDNANSGSIYYDNIYATFNNSVFFIANDGTNGNELWKTDGTVSGTVMVKDINTGVVSSFIEKIHVDEFNNKLLFFVKGTGSTERTLWVSDGTNSGTSELLNIAASSVGNYSGVSTNFISLNNSTILTGENEVYGNEMWITDGTQAGTSFFVDLNHKDGSLPDKFTKVNDKMLFRARGLEYGRQLFISDGTIEGTKMVKDINEEYSFIEDEFEMTNMNGIVYFGGNDGIYGSELWKSDGTEAGTVLVKDINVGNQSSIYVVENQSYVPINNQLYFRANDGINGYELWKSDGTEVGTVMIKDLNPGAPNNHSHPREFVSYGGLVYFIAADGQTTALWKTDGTETGTVKVIDLNDMRVLEVVNGKLLIVAETSGTTYGPHDLWVSDGTASGTTHIQTFGDGNDSSISHITVMNNNLYFVANNYDNAGTSVYKSDGTVSGTVRLFNGFDHPISNLDIDNIDTCGDFVYFGVQESLSSADIELWRTDGTVSGTIKVADSGIPNFAYVRYRVCYNDNLLFLAEDWPKNIWAINGAMTVPIQMDINIANGPNMTGNDQISNLGVGNDKLYISASTENSGEELYISSVDLSGLSVEEYGLSNNILSKYILVYPNPANDNITIKSLNNISIISFEIFDFTGKNLGRTSNKSLSAEVNYSINSLSTGIYLIKTHLSNGKIVNTKFFVN